MDRYNISSTCLQFPSDEWEWRGKWPIRHHRKPRRKTFRPDLRLCDFSLFELEDFKAVICQEYPGNGKKAERYLFNN
eukprot:12930266-Prorocentrum_lima.AAC.1